MLTTSIVNKILHVPTVKMKEVAGRDQCYLYVDAVRTLFDLDTEEGADEPAAGDGQPGRAAEHRRARTAASRPPPPAAPSIACAAPGRRTREHAT